MVSSVTFPKTLTPTRKKTNQTQSPFVTQFIGYITPHARGIERRKERGGHKGRRRKVCSGNINKKRKPVTVRWHSVLHCFALTKNSLFYHPINRLSHAHVALHTAFASTGPRPQTIGGQDGVLVPQVSLLQGTGRDSCMLAHLEQQLVLCHLHLRRQAGPAVLMSHQCLQGPHVDTEGTKALGEAVKH